MHHAAGLIVKTLSYVLAIIGICMSAPLLTGIFCHEYHVASAFAISMLLCAVISIPLLIFFKDRRWKVYSKGSILILCSAWIFASLITAMPYFISGVAADFTEALFEACSGFTTTGATIFNNVEILPKSILLWRSLTQWTGAAFFLIFAALITPSLFPDGTALSSVDKPHSSFSHSFKYTFRIITAILSGYVLLTLLQTIVLFFSGMNAFDAVICTMGTISTGGFSNYNDGISHFDSNIIKVVIAVFMAFSGLSFSLIYKFKMRGISVLRSNSEFHLYLSVILISSALITAGLVISHNGGVLQSAGNALFETISVITTTGYASTEYTIWPSFCQTVLIMLLLIGGCSHSQACGNKIIRLSIMLKLVKHGIETRLHSNAVTTVKINRLNLPATMVSEVANHLFLYTAVVFGCAILLSFEGLSMSDSFSDSLSLIGNVGISFKNTGFIIARAEFNPVTNILICLFMIAGRLELYNLLVLFMPSFWKGE